MSHVDDDPTTQVPPAIDPPRPAAETGAPAGPSADDGGAATGGAEAPLKGKQRRSEWRRTEAARRYAARNSVRFPIFTRSVLLWLLIFALVGVAFGASGAFWWANFNTQVSQLRSDTQNFESRSQSAAAGIDAQRKKALDEIAKASAPLNNLQAQTQIVQLAASFSPSVYEVTTQDNQGRPIVGTAFSVQTDNGSSLMLTSYTVVAAAALAPGPGISLVKGTDQIQATLWAWDAAHDMALLKVTKGNIPVLDWADDKAQAKNLGAYVFPISGTGGAGATLTSGILVDQSQAGFRHLAPLDSDFQGGPIINRDGKVIGMASLTYAPPGYTNGQVHWAPPIAMACSKVLSCGSGTRAAGAQGG